jgi:hypothetical protein
VSNPDSYESLVELLIPELQKRGRMWTDYAVPGGTFRENLYGLEGQPYLPEHHPGHQFKWHVKKAKDAEAAESKVATENASGTGGASEVSTIPESTAVEPTAS